MSNDNKKAEVRIIAGIDALYFQLVISESNYSLFYDKCKYEKFCVLPNMEMLSKDWTKQYTFFEYLENEKRAFRIGFKNLNKKDGLEYVSIQLDTVFMNTYGVIETYEKVLEYISNLGLEVLGSKITRLDLNTYVYGYDFSYIDVNYFETQLQTDSLSKGTRKELQTFYLGKRDNNKSALLRIYDKWLEMSVQDKTGEKQALILYKFYKKYNIHLDIDVPLWNVEWELKREYFRTKWNLSSVEEILRSVNIIFDDLMEKNKLMYYRYDKKNKNKMVAPVWNKIQKEYNFNDSYYPTARIKSLKNPKDEVWLSNRINEYFNGLELEDYELSKLRYIANDFIRALNNVRLNHSVINQRLKQEYGEKKNEQYAKFN